MVVQGAWRSAGFPGSTSGSIAGSARWGGFALAWCRIAGIMAKASMTGEIWRCQPYKEQVSLWSRPSSFLAVSKLSSMAQRCPSTATSFSMDVPTGHHPAPAAQDRLLPPGSEIACRIRTHPSCLTSFFPQQAVQKDLSRRYCYTLLAEQRPHPRLYLPQRRRQKLKCRLDRCSCHP